MLTLKIIIIPTKKSFHEADKPIKIKVVFNIDISKTASTVPKMVPLPPFNLAPPKTTAAIMVNS
jgi:hypothetical protein